MIINKRTKKNNFKLVIKIVIPILAIILFISLICYNIKNTEKRKEYQKIKSYTSIDQFTTIEEVAIYMDCEYIKQEQSKTEDYTTDIYMKINLTPFTNEKSNKDYYEKLFAYCAKVLEYQNFVIIDKSKELVIGVVCSKNDKMITSYNVNGNSRFFQIEESKIAKKQYVEIKEIEYELNSAELTQIIKQNWNVDDSILGTKDSVFRNYSIYFDEGISVRKINGTIYNVVFSKNYKKEIINGITTSSDRNEIIEKLGSPQFDENQIVGYKTKDAYVFFYNNEISVYKNEKNTKTLEFAKLVEQFENDNDLIKFTTNLKNIWPDYDFYEYNNNSVVLQYALKGISIRYNYKSDNGIYMYNNFNGNIIPQTTYEQILNNQSELPSEVYIKNENLVFLAEKQRISRQKEIKCDISNVIKNQSNQYSIDILTMPNLVYQISFISKDENRPNRELKEFINYGIWLDNDNFIYSIKQKGIYKYNVSTNTYSTIVSGNENFEVKTIQNGILKYDDKTITI